MRHVLKKIACPALVVQGFQDEHATPQHARDIAAAIPGAQLWLLQGAQHMLPQENAVVFNQRLLQFLDACND
jgi:pimeloyl-ACP methyl ester carboxylesterase